MNPNDDLIFFVQELVETLNERYEKSCCLGDDDISTIFNKGAAFAYYDVLDIIKQQLIVLGTDVNVFEPIVPVLKSGNYTYTEFSYDLGLGREIEFTYNGIKYSITNTPNGFVFSEFNGEYKFYENIEELIEMTRIDNRNIKDLWWEITIDCIF